MTPLARARHLLAETLEHLAGIPEAADLAERIRAELAPPPRPARRRVSISGAQRDTLRRSAVTAYTGGLSLRDVAEAIGRRPGTVRNLLLEAVRLGELDRLRPRGRNLASASLASRRRVAADEREAMRRAAVEMVAVHGSVAVAAAYVRWPNGDPISSSTMSRLLREARNEGSR